MYILEKVTTLVIGNLLIAIGVNVFLVPFDLIDGGALGISLIFHYVMGAKVGLTFLLVSIPIFIIAWIFYRPFFFNGIHGLLLSSLFIDVLYPLHVIGQNIITAPLLSAACGGILIGVGVGIMLRLNISIGGTDLLAQMIAKNMNINPGFMIFCIDILVVTIGSLVVDSVYLVFSLVTVFIVGITTSLIVSTSSKAMVART